MNEEREQQADGWHLLEWLLVLAALVMLSLTLWSLTGTAIRAAVNDFLNPPTPIPTRRPTSWHSRPHRTIGIDGMTWEDFHTRITYG